MAKTQSTHRLNFPSAFAIWAALLLAVIFAGFLRGYGGRIFGIVMGVFAVLLAGLIFSAARNFREKWQDRIGDSGIILAPLAPLAAFAVYGINVGLRPQGIFIGCAYILLPSLFVLGAKGRAGIRWTDFAAVVVIWLPVEFRWMYRLLPYPRELTHTLTILFALNTALAAFVYVRRLDGIGYSVEWSSGIAAQVAIHFALCAAILIPVGEAIHFIHFGPSAANFHPLALLTAVLGISFFTAWPEEFLFRGLLQNLLSKVTKSEWSGLGIAAVIFGFSHILHAPFPNWKYVFLATIAGLLYGHVWMRTRTIFASAIVHALVDILWHLLFR